MKNQNNVFEKKITLAGFDEELDWHTDGATRFMKVIEGVGWQFQFEGESPN